MEKFTTTGAGQTRKMGEMLAKELLSGALNHSVQGEKIICLEGELGSGKTTFAQGILKGLKVKGPYTSPTFVIMKHYQLTTHNKKDNNKLQATSYKLHIYHIDAYRVNSVDILELGWEEIVKNKNNVIIIEWADRIKKIIPKSAVWFKFKWMGKNKREIKISK